MEPFQMFRSFKQPPANDLLGLNQPTGPAEEQWKPAEADFSQLFDPPVSTDKINDRPAFKKFPPEHVLSDTQVICDGHFGNIRETPDPIIDRGAFLPELEHQQASADRRMDGALDILEFVGWVMLLLGALLLLISFC